MADRGTSNLTHEKKRANLVDFGPVDLDHMHVKNLRPSISLVKFDGCDLISQSTNDQVTRGCLWTLDKARLQGHQLHMVSCQK